MSLYEQYKAESQNPLQLTQLTPPPSSGTYSISFENHNDDNIKDEVPALRQQPLCSFKQTLPSLSLRYSKKELVHRSPLTFYPDLILSSNPNTNSLFVLVPEPYSQEGWESYIHPEGLKYYYHPQFRVLTDANIKIPHIYTTVNSYIHEFSQICSTHSIDLPLSFEVVLELDPEDYNSPSYYIVDNDRHTVFFLDPSYSVELGLPDPASIDNLKLQLQRQYWKHVEYFPAHRPASKSIEHTLIAILSHAWTDGTTSKLSTSPHSPEACKEFLEILRNFTGKPEQEAYRTCIIGRLMDEFTQARCINLYGEEQGARLSNNQSNLPTPELTRTCPFYEITSVMFLRQPERELDILNNLWVDKIAYTASWRLFIRERMEEWKNVITISLVFGLIDILLVLALRSYASISIWSNYFPQILAYQLALMSLLLNISSSVIGLVALSIHSPLSSSTASDAASYFTSAWHNVYGFRLLAVVLSLPRSLSIWALAGTCLSIVALSLETMSTLTLIFTGCFTILLGGIIVWAIAFLQVGNEGLGIKNILKMLSSSH